MKVKGIDPRDLCLRLLKRSRCAVQVAACLKDAHSVHGWGWNSEGPDGFGEHAEINALKRSNYKRAKKSVMFVAAQRRKSKGIVTAKPCGACWPVVKQCAYVVYRDKAGKWVTLMGDSV